MPTTIQIDKETLEMLKTIREQTHSSSYNEVINKMIKQKNKISMYGALGKKSMKQILKGLRDENDRF